MSVGRKKFSADFQLVFRLIEGFIFLSFVSLLISLIVILHLKFRDIIVCILAFMPTGWGMLMVSATSIPLCLRHSLCSLHPAFIISDCSSFEALDSTWWLLGVCQDTEIIMGLLLFTPIAFLAWCPFVSEFHTYLRSFYHNNLLFKSIYNSNIFFQNFTKLV